MKLSLTDEYFNWLCSKVKTPDEDRSYRALLWNLQCTPFEYSIWRDGNREADGIELRYQFGSEKGVAESAVACLLDVVSCSVLEMMVALAIRCEQIMETPEMEGLSAAWFWDMIASLGLLPYDDAHYDQGSVDFILYLFQERRYRPNGAGGLFTLKHPPKDLTKVEIWYQAMWWLDEILYS